VAPAWSPDGKQIAFVRKHVGADQDIFLMDADGSGTTPITSGSGQDYRPTWSPDGTHIAFERDGDTPAASGIFVIKVDGSGLRQILSGHDADPNWSHDGTRISFWNGSGHGALQVVTLASDEVLTVATSEQLHIYTGTAGDPSWSPDDTTIAVGGDADTSAQISLVRADGTGVTGLSGLRGVSPSWKPV
jgi:TolB protein